MASSFPNPEPLTPEEIKLIKACVPILAVHGKTITTTFYHNMLGSNPDLKNIFSHSAQQTGHQSSALAGSILAYAENIDNLSVLLPVVERIAHKHTSIFVQPEQYHIVGENLLQALKQVLGDAFTKELFDVWFKAYWILARIFIDTEKKIYEDALWKDWKKFKVEKKVEESENITSFYFVPVDHTPLPAYKPGQYIAIRHFLPKLNLFQSRQYSLSDVHNPNYYRISVKKEMGIPVVDEKGDLSTEHFAHPGWISNYLHEFVQPGEEFGLATPHGDFFLDDESESPVVLISAGVGVTPMVAMLNKLYLTKRKVTYIHVTRNAGTHAFKEHVDDITRLNPDVKKVIFYSQPIDETRLGIDFDFRGRLDFAKIDPSLLHFEDKSTQFYVCGPKEFMAHTNSTLEKLGVNKNNIRYEIFGAGKISTK
eukprot:TRINITY_DN203_c0_g1_i1.p1 TRINITY_DN203_c0_g1~~TRINITY_DN203_c0_g1_i1.p1  ORF type:complete len:424 (+),score=89.18 TRINITY_DN203_c0_g1_i1:107-1378(+)